jgi:hypothetical protein
MWHVQEAYRLGMVNKQFADMRHIGNITIRVNAKNNKIPHPNPICYFSNGDDTGGLWSLSTIGLCAERWENELLAKEESFECLVKNMPTKKEKIDPKKSIDAIDKELRKGIREGYEIALVLEPMETFLILEEDADISNIYMTPGQSDKNRDFLNAGNFNDNLMREVRSKHEF